MLQLFFLFAGRVLHPALSALSFSEDGLYDVVHVAVEFEGFAVRVPSVQLIQVGALVLDLLASSSGFLPSASQGRETVAHVEGTNGEVPARSSLHSIRMLTCFLVASGSRRRLLRARAVRVALGIALAGAAAATHYHLAGKLLLLRLLPFCPRLTIVALVPQPADRAPIYSFSVRLVAHRSGTHALAAKVRWLLVSSLESWISHVLDSLSRSARCTSR